MSHGTKDLVICCMDYRFRERVAQWIQETLANTADLVSVAGASKAITSEQSREYIFSLIDIGRNLHGVTTVHILDHIDCGAYGGSSQHTDQAAETTFHSNQCQQATALLAAKYPDLTVKSYYMDFDAIQSA